MEEQMKLAIDYNIQIAKEIEAIAGAYWRMAQLDLDMARRYPRGSIGRKLCLDAAVRQQVIASGRYQAARYINETLRLSIMNAGRTLEGGNSHA